MSPILRAATAASRSLQCYRNQLTHADLNAFVRLADTSEVYSDAQREDENSSGCSLSGRLIAVKDNICTENLPTTAASGVLDDFMSPFDATVVKLLRDDGAIIVGKTNMDEFGMGSHSTHSRFGVVKQKGPNGEYLSAGGSSGGSAVAVATGQCWAALGTDTGGSVRLPAAYTRTVGFKPSYGLLSRWGVIDYANSLDTVGILASQVQAARDVFRTLNRHDPLDPTSLLPSTRNRLPSAQTSQLSSDRALLIGIPIDYNIASLDSAVHSAWIATVKSFQQTFPKATFHPIRLPSTRHALSAYYILAPAEASSNLAKYDGIRYGHREPGPDGTPWSVLFSKTRGTGFGREVKRRILLGTFSLSADAIDNYFIQAQKIRRLVQSDFDAVFATRNPLLKASAKPGHDSADTKVDVILCPTAPTPPPILESLRDKTFLDAFISDVFTVPASLAGLPAISVPVSHNEGIGMQIIGQFGDDERVLDVAGLLEKAVGSREKNRGIEYGALRAASLQKRPKRVKVESH